MHAAVDEEGDLAMFGDAVGQGNVIGVPFHIAGGLEAVSTPPASGREVSRIALRFANAACNVSNSIRDAVRHVFEKHCKCVDFR